MQKSYLVVGLLWLCLGYILCAVPDDEDLYFGPGNLRRVDDDISGDGPGRGFDIDAEFSDDEDDDDASGSGLHPIVSDCQAEKVLRQQKLRNGMTVDYLPRCTAQHEYDALQCTIDEDECFCVTFSGQEIPKTRKTRPHQPNCRFVDRNREYSVEPPIRPDSSEGHGTNPGGSDDGGDDDVSFEDETSDGDADVFKQETVERPSLFSQPLILAAIIALAVVCLLCAVLLVMFIVYRMRKKDEGSYALDEPKPTHLYQRAPTKEYYA